MKLTAFILLIACLQVSARTGAQTVTLSLKNASLETVFTEIKKQTGYSFVYNNSLLERAKKVTVIVQGASLEEVLEKCFDDQPLTYSIIDRTIVVKPKTSIPNEKATTPVKDLPPPIEIRGRVVNENGEPVEGVTVTVRGTKNATSTDRQGRFKLNVEGETARVTISSVGMAPITVLVRGNTLSVENQKEAAQGKMDENARSTASMDQNGFITVQLARLVREEEAIVITGIVNKRKESFTGSAATYTQKELKEVGGTNILQSLKTLDPAFAMRENVQFGSDPNRLPDVEVRGKTSLLGVRTELGVDPNQPLFILDGFESSLSAINDLDINLVASITILKDAASTAIYGSKAANGVVVVETIKPQPGKMRVTYNSNYNIQAPDLSSYNMMDASEKLEFERLAGVFDRVDNTAVPPTEADLIMAELYNSRVRLLAQGVNTNWMAEPLRVGTDMKHSLTVGGGQEKFQFSIGGGYNGMSGVMKGSKRTVLNGNINLNYRVSKLQFSNLFSVSSARSERELVPFYEFSRANPFYKKTNNGVVEPYLENTATTQVFNPIWNATRNSRNTGNDLRLMNALALEWFPSKNWRVRGKVGLTWNNTEGENFVSPEDTRQWTKEVARRGTFTSSNGRLNRSELDLTVSYAKVIKGHQINLAAGGNINSSNGLSQGYVVEGFTPNSIGDFTYPNYSSGFIAGSRPSYYENAARSLDAYFNGGYSFNDRYLMDLTLRTSGSSVFGIDRRFNNTWSVGLGWNLHREKFIKSNMRWIDFLKIRGSIGNPGNQNFSSQTAITTYYIPSGIDSYFGLSALPLQLGNPELRWQTTQDKNIGIDLTTFKKRFSLNVDYFHKLTDPLLISIGMPPSSGTGQYSTNAGGQTTQGINFATSYQILRNTQRQLLWTVRFNGRTLKSRLHGIGNKLDKFTSNHPGGTLIRYRDGTDPDDMWAIISYGIDPSTGRELFLDKDGKFTYDYTTNNEVIVGNRRPDLEGIAGSSFSLRGFTVNLSFRYQFGAEVYNSALRDKVENVDLFYNQDRRALYDRWHKPGDVRPFKNVKDNRNLSPLTSRFVQTQKSFIWESIYASYEFRNGWVKRARLGNFKVFASVRDLLQIATMQAERGIHYPFARVIDTGLSFNF